MKEYTQHTYSGGTKNVAVPIESHPFAVLANAQYINLTTFRKSSAAVATPVWFAERAGTLYLQTLASTGKVKRIRHTARVTVAPCTATGKVTGATLEGKARILRDPQEVALAENALAQKYGLIRRLYSGLMAALYIIRRKQRSEATYLAIEPS